MHFTQIPRSFLIFLKHVNDGLYGLLPVKSLLTMDMMKKAQRKVPHLNFTLKFVLGHGKL